MFVSAKVFPSWNSSPSKWIYTGKVGGGGSESKSYITAVPPGFDKYQLAERYSQADGVSTSEWLQS